MGIKEEIERLEAQRKAYLAGMKAQGTSWAEETRTREQEEQLAEARALEKLHAIDEVLIKSKLSELGEELNRRSDNISPLWSLIPMKGNASKTQYSISQYDGGDGNQNSRTWSIGYFGYALARKETDLATRDTPGYPFSYWNPVGDSKPQSFLNRVLKPQLKSNLISTDYLMFFAGNIEQDKIVQSLVTLMRGMNTKSGEIVPGSHFENRYPPYGNLRYETLEYTLSHSYPLQQIDESLISCTRELPEFKQK